ncbi:hypothetical protein A9Q99_15265 [Gammaproteobacteria bacterium 45_16_T64]|nr:hypothetical protein A9Q99_15265 [Gammaproteobacteria bacterium 45_16_T64]
MNTPLPINNIQAEFLSLLSVHTPHHQQHIVVEANTGSGKSTQLPIWVADHQRDKKVLIIEPRRIACVALATYVSSLVSSPLGQRVGYAIRFDQRYGPETQIQFVTPGIALRWLADNQLAEYDTIIIDEFHERRWDTDLLLALLKAPPVCHRIILTSATIKGQQLANYLGATRLQSPGKMFPVDMHYHAEQPQQMPSTQSLEVRVRKACEYAITQLTQQHSQQDQREQPKDILVFLPGRKEIQNSFQQLQPISQHHHVEVICLSASSSKAEQQRALNQQSTQRIILSTNVAETSLTIPNIGVVIDSGMERRTHQRNGRTVLGLDPISSASADQRKGRAGRLSEGHCIRLWGEHAPLRDTTPPEILREELTELMLAAACNDATIDTLSFPEPLPEKSIDVARNRLLGMNAITTQGKATTHGMRLYPLPIDTLYSHLITAMPDTTTQSAMIDLVAALSTSQKLLTIPKSERGRQALVDWSPLDCDAFTLIQCMRQPPPEDISVNSNAIKEAQNLSAQIHHALDLASPSQNLAAPHKRFDRSSFVRALAIAAPELVFVRREKRRAALGNGFSEVVIGDNSRFAENAEAALVFDQYNMPGKNIRDTLNIATCLAPMRLQDIIAAQLATKQLGHVRWNNHQLLVDTELYYAGRKIGAEKQSPTQQHARNAITELIINDRLFAPLGTELAGDIQDFSLYQHLSVPQTEQRPIPTLPQWLMDRLKTLGVESGEDIALIDPSDLSFDGVPDWEKQEFQERYPHKVTLCDLVLAVEYQVSKKLITVERISGTRKGEPKRWELPSWSGWRIRYKKASRIVDIR